MASFAFRPNKVSTKTVSLCKRLKLLFFLTLISCNLHGMEPQVQPGIIERHATGLPNIKNTLAILNKGYERFSLIHGAIAWETGIIRRLYDFGHIFPRYEDRQGRKIIIGYDNPDQMHKVVRLVHALFYRIPGSTGVTDFGITTQLNNNDPNYLAGLMAQIIAEWDQLQKHFGQFGDTLNGIEKFVKEFDKKTLQEKLGSNFLAKFDKQLQLLQEVPWNNKNKNDFISICITMFKKLEAPFGDLYKKPIENFSAVFSSLIKNIEKLLKHQVVFKKGENIGQIIYWALNECNSSIYPENTVHTVLLAFVYAKCRQDRSFFKMFYDALDKQLDGKLTNPAWLSHSMIGIKEEWTQDSFDAIDQQTALISLNEIFKLDEQDIIQKMDAILYSIQQIRSLPSPMNFTDVTYEYTPGKKTKPFPDCMCNTIRNFINVLSYDAKNNRFDMTILKEKLLKKNLVFNPLLENFYKQHEGINDASSMTTHNDWIKVISNIPYAAYKKSTGNSEANGKAINAIKWGYITIPEKEKNHEALTLFLENNGYQILPNNEHGYELMPSVRNIIVVLNHLLGLNLFEDALIEEFISANFVKKNLAQLCTALQAKKCFQSAIKHDDEADDKINFDNRDFSGKKIFSTFIFRNPQFSYEIRTENGIHGEPYLRGGLSREEDALCKLLRLKTCNISNLSFRFMLINTMCRNKIDFSCFGAYQHNPGYLLLFSIPLENADFFQEFINNLKKSINSDSLSCQDKSSLINLLLRLACKQTTDGARSNAVHSIFSQWKSTENMKIFKEYASYAVNSQDSYIQSSGIEILGKLIERGNKKIFKHALAVASNTLQSDDDSVQAAGADLFLVLLQNGYEDALDDALKAASKLSKSHDDNVLLSVVEIFKVLIKNQYPDVYEIALEAALYAIKSDDINRQRIGLNLLLQLINSGDLESLSSILEIVSVLQQSTNNQKIEFAHDILRALIKEEYEEAYGPTTDAAWNAINSPVDYIKSIGLGTFTSLVKNGILRSFDKAIQAADNILKYTAKQKKYAQIHDAAIQLFMMILKIAAAATLSDNTFDQSAGIDLLKKLKKAYPIETQKTIQKLLQSEDIEEIVKEDLRKIL